MSLKMLRIQQSPSLKYVVIWKFTGKSEILRSISASHSEDLLVLNYQFMSL